MSGEPETIEAEVVETMVPAVRAEQSLTLFGTRDPVEVIEKATELAQPLAALVRDRDLITMIHGREHVQVEGWTLLGSMLGVFPVTTWVREIDGTVHPTFKKVTRTRRDGSSYEARVVDKPGRGGFVARVEAKTQAGAVVGAGEMECRYEEANWSDCDAYALKSMAQTRATSKAMRLPLGFVMQLAGFSSTPAEEMIHGTNEQAEAGSSHVCPSCGSRVFDNNADVNDAIARVAELEAAGEPVPESDSKAAKRPRWKCSNRLCQGGGEKNDGGRWPWASWDAHEFDSWRDKIIGLISTRITDGDLKAAAEYADAGAAEIGHTFDDLDAMEPLPARELANTIYLHVREVLVPPDELPDRDYVSGGDYA